MASPLGSKGASKMRSTPVGHKWKSRGEIYCARLVDKDWQLRLFTSFIPQATRISQDSSDTRKMWNKLISTLPMIPEQIWNQVALWVCELQSVIQGKSYSPRVLAIGWIAEVRIEQVIYRASQGLLSHLIDTHFCVSFGSHWFSAWLGSLLPINSLRIASAALGRVSTSFCAAVLLSPSFLVLFQDLQPRSIDPSGLAHYTMCKYMEKAKR
jgi:hypothetical protein